jgi:hypothetical protein
MEVNMTDSLVIDLAFPYKRGASRLPRREFIVTQRRCPTEWHPLEDPAFSVYVTFSVTAPDPDQAVRLVRKYTDTNLLPGWHSHTEPRTVREVTREWDGQYGYNAPVVRVSDVY